MHLTVRLLPLLFSILAATPGLRAAAPAPKQAEYKRADTNFYLKSDIARANPSAVILPQASYVQKGDSYFFTPKKRAPKILYVEVINDWIEPVTPPDAPAALAMAPDAMEIREPQGDVQVALPSAPANFAPATDGMTLPNGAVVKTGPDGTAAVLFGGVNSARLIPGSEAAVQQTVAPQSRATEIDLSAGAVFSKVGKQIGVTQDYRVHTPFGVAAARGTDFVTVAMPKRTDVWIAQGTVELDQVNGEKVGTVSSEGTGTLKIIRYPLMTAPHEAMMADAETMTAAMNFIPLADRKIKALRDKLAAGTALTPGEQDYMHRIKQVPGVIKLALVEPPAPPPPPRPAPVDLFPAPLPAPLPPPSVATATPAPAPGAKISPLTVRVRRDGKVDFKHAALSLDELKPKLTEIAQAMPTQPFIIRLGRNATAAQYQEVAALFDTAGLKNVTLATPLPPAAPATPPAPRPVPIVSAPVVAPAPAPAPVPAPVATTAAAPAKPRYPVHTDPVNTVFVHPDGTVRFRGATLDNLAKLQVMLKDAVRATPNESFYVNAVTEVPYEQIQAVLDAFKSADVQVTSLDIHTPDVPPVVRSKPAHGPDIPPPLMHPAMQTVSGDAPLAPRPPDSSTSNPNPAAKPSAASPPENPPAP